MIDSCAICDGVLSDRGRCIDEQCYKKHQFVSLDNYAELIVGNYMVEYHFDDAGKFDKTLIVGGWGIKILCELDYFLDFTNQDPFKLMERFEKLQVLA